MDSQNSQKDVLYILNKTSRGPIGILVGFSILLFCIYRIGFNDIFQSLLGARPHFIIFVFAVLSCWVALGALNIKIMLKPLVTPLYLAVFRFYCKANMLALVTPGQIGDTILIGFFKQLSVPLVQGAAIFSIDKLITLFWYIVLSSYGIYLLEDSLWQLNLPASEQFISGAKFIFFCIALVSCAFLIYLKQKFISQERINNWIRLLKEYLSKGKQAVFLNWCTTLIRTIFLGGAYWLMIKSYGPSLPFLPTLCFSIMGGMVAYIPISFNGLGTVEASHIFLFSTIGIEPAPILAATVSLRLMMIVTLSLGILLSKYLSEKSS